MATFFKTQNLILGKQLISATGNSLYVNNIELIAGVSGNLSQSGIVLIARDSAISGALNEKIGASGSLNYTLLTGMSGQAVIDYATKQSLTQSGINIGNQINSLSGFATGISGALQIQINNLGGTYATIANLALTGSQAWNAANNNAINLSGALSQTGITLIARDSAISGVLQTAINAIAAGTGAINNNVVYTTGVQLIGGTKYFVGNTYIDNLFVTGTQFTVNTVDFTVGDNWIILNATGGARDSALFISTGITGISATGAILGLDVPSNSWRFGFGSQQTDLITLPRIASGEAVDALDSRLTQSGINLGVIIGNTGSASWNAANNNGINLSGNLTQTGITLFARDIAISGGLEARIALTGSQGWNAAQNNAINLSGNLAATSSTLNNKIDSLSGYSDNIFIHRTGNELISGNKTFTGQSLFLTPILVSASVTQPHTVAAPQAIIDVQSTLSQTNPSGIIIRRNATQYMHLHQFDGASHIIDGIGDKSIVIRNGQTSSSIDTLVVGRPGIAAQFRFDYFGNFVMGNDLTANIISGNNFYSGAIALSDLLYPRSNPSGFITGLQGTGNLASVAQLIALSGYVNAQDALTGSASWTAANNNTINLSGNLTQTGITLIARDLAVSGGLEARIALTGQQAWSAARNNSINLSGNLFSTGRDAVGNFGQISLHSAHTSFNTTPARWGWTYVQGNTGAPNQVSAQWYRARIGLGSEYTIGTGAGSDYWLQMAVPRYGNKDIWFQTTEAGTTGVWIPAGVTVSGVLAASALAISGGINTVIGATGSAAWSAAQNNAVNLSGNLTATGITLFARDAAISGGLEIRLGVTGSVAVVHANNIGSIISGNLTQTGITLFARDTAISGGLEARISVTGNLINARIDSLSGYLNRPIIPSITVSALYIVTSNDPQIIYCNFSNPTALVFPSASTVSGRMWNIKSINTGAIYLSGSTFDGQSVYNMSVPFMSQVIHAQAGGYHLID